MFLKNENLLALIVFLTVPLSGISIDIYAPSLPSVGNYFSVGGGSSQLTITAYLLGLGITQLISGSISDSFGRKKPFMWGMLAFIISNFLIPFSPNINTLIGLRFLQGSVLALFVVPMRSVFADVFKGGKLQKMMTYMTIAWSLGPIIAPAIGGVIQHYWGWKANFYVLGTYSLIIFIMSLFFHYETSTNNCAFNAKDILKLYQTMLFNRSYLVCILMGGVLFSIISLYAIAGPFLIQTVLHYSAAQFGKMTLFLGLSWFLGSMVNRTLLKLSFSAKSSISLLLMLLVAIVMLVINVKTLTLYNLLIPMSFIFFFCGVLYPSYFIRSVMLFRQFSASANALYNSAAFFISGVISYLYTLIQFNSALQFVVVLMVLIGLCHFINLQDRGKNHA